MRTRQSCSFHGTPACHGRRACLVSGEFRRISVHRGNGDFGVQILLSQHNTTTLCTVCVRGSIPVIKARTNRETSPKHDLELSSLHASESQCVTFRNKFDVPRTRLNSESVHIRIPDATPNDKMGRAEAGSTKAISNKLKSKGLTRLRWYCQVCEKACRDANAFKYVLALPPARSFLFATGGPDANDGLGCTACPSLMFETWS